MAQNDREVMNDEIRLEEIHEVLDRLRELAVDHVILIEGMKDRKALDWLGITGDMFQIQSQGGPAKAAEYVEQHGGKAVVLTDWDRTGGAIASALRGLLGPDNGDIDFSVRADLSCLCRHYIKDVEALDSLVERLQGDAYLRPPCILESESIRG